MFVIRLPPLSLPTKTELGILENTEGILLILGGRSYAQHNTVVYRQADQYRGMPHRHCILMNIVDIKKAGFTEHQKVKVKGNAGQLDEIEIISGAVKAGTAFMFYPEANVLFHAKVDPLSGTPAYKRVPIYVFV